MKRIITAIAASLIFSSHAAAATVTLSFQGESNVAGTVLTPVFGDLLTFSGNIIFNTDEPAISTVSDANSETAFFDYQSFEITLNGESFLFDPDGSFGRDFVIRDSDSPTLSDNIGFRAGGGIDDITINSFSFDNVLFSLSSDNSSSAALPLDASSGLSFPDLMSQTLFFQFEFNGSPLLLSENNVMVSITDISEVPLPAAFPLFIAGLAGIGIIQRKRRQF